MARKSFNLKNSFDKRVSDKTIERINSLNPKSKLKWGKMTLEQMLAHCSVTYEMVFTNKHPKPSVLKKFTLKTFVKRPCLEKNFMLEMGELLLNF